MSQNVLHVVQALQFIACVYILFLGGGGGGGVFRFLVDPTLAVFILFRPLAVSRFYKTYGKS